MTFDAMHEKLKSDFEAYLEGVFDECFAPREIMDAMGYSLYAGGKRLRPCISLYLARKLGIEDEVSLPICAALEMIHTYSLIHDDLPAMDDDDLRRGRPTCHVVYGEDMAILAGDGLLNYAFELMLRNYSAEYGKKYIDAISYVAGCAGVSGMIGGQVLDIKKRADRIEELKEMHSLKTGKLFMASIMPMVYLAGLETNVQSAYMSFAKNFGLLFQITDDILDVIGDTQTLGKTTGKDEKDGKITYVSHYGLKDAQKLAEKIADECKANLRDTGRANEYLALMIDKILQRKK